MTNTLNDTRGYNILSKLVLVIFYVFIADQLGTVVVNPHM